MGVILSDSMAGGYPLTWTARKLDARNSLYLIFDYQIKCSLPGYFEVRDWCVAQWGMGIEAEHWHNHERLRLPARAWAWDSHKHMGKPLRDGKIYINESQMTLFQLRWS